MKITQKFKNSKIYPALRKFTRGIEKTIKRIVNINSFKDGQAAIRKYKNFYEGRRCFIIGNGPSLTVSDLDKIKNAGEISIASNSIYNLYDKTEWRPTIYTISDFLEIKHTLKEISALKPELKIVAMSAVGRVFNVDNAILLKLIDKDEKEEKVFFSDDISNCIYDGATVTYTSIQCAVYLGFKEIILLGVDHSFAQERTKDGLKINTGIKNHFENYLTDYAKESGSDDEEYFIFPVDFATMAFEKAKEYTDAHGIKIFNATRGGKLEVFERVDFDALF